MGRDGRETFPPSIPNFVTFIIVLANRPSFPFFDFFFSLLGRPPRKFGNAAKIPRDDTLNRRCHAKNCDGIYWKSFFNFHVHREKEREREFDIQRWKQKGWNISWRGKLRKIPVERGGGKEGDLPSSRKFFGYKIWTYDMNLFLGKLKRNLKTRPLEET